MMTVYLRGCVPRAVLAAVLVMSLGGCPGPEADDDTSTIDVGTQNGTDGTDGTDDVDTDPPVLVPPRLVLHGAVTNAQRVQSLDHRLIITIGSPVSSSELVSSNHSLELGSGVTVAPHP